MRLPDLIGPSAPTNTWPFTADKSLARGDGKSTTFVTPAIRELAIPHQSDTPSRLFGRRDPGKPHEMRLSPAALLGTSARRLSALDGSFLRLESTEAHMHVGWSGVFTV